MRLLITGATGHLGPYLLREANNQGLGTVGWRQGPSTVLFDVPIHSVDVTDQFAVAQAMAGVAPTHIIHAAALSAIADCYRNPQAAQRINVDGTRHVLKEAQRWQARTLLVSTDLVFDGQRGGYTEADEPRPLSIYGHSKLSAERIAAEWPDALIVRVSWLLGPKLFGEPRFLDDVLAKLRCGQTVRLFADEFRSPLPLTWAARALIDAVRSPARGLLHLAGPVRMSRWEMGCRTAKALGLRTDLILPGSQADVPSHEPRPKDVSLRSLYWGKLFPTTPTISFEAGLYEVFAGSSITSNSSQ